MTTHGKRSGLARVTLSEVAQDAGVSLSTASLVVRGSSLISQVTRQRVLSSMERLGYVYDRVAANLRSQRSNSVGLIMTDISNPFFAELTVGIQDRLDEAGYTLLLGTTSDSVSKQARLLATTAEHRVDGILLCPAEGTSPDVIDRLRKWRMPIVLVCRYLFDTEVDYVGADNVLGAQMGVEHLIGRGYHRIAFVGGASTSSSWRDRTLGYRVAMARNGLKVDESLLCNSPATRQGGYEVITRLLALPNPPTAALCYNDIVAFGVMLGLQAQGMTPGRNFAVVGFDDIEESALWRPALTTIGISPRRIGREAATLWLQRIDDPDGPVRRLNLPPELMVRETCGANPPKGGTDR